MRSACGGLLIHSQMSAKHPKRTLNRWTKFHVPISNRVRRPPSALGIWNAILLVGLFFISAGAGSPFYKRVLSVAGGSRLRLAEVDQAGEHCQTAIASSDRRSGTKHAHPCFRKMEQWLFTHLTTFEIHLIAIPSIMLGAILLLGGIILLVEPPRHDNH